MPSSSPKTPQDPNGLIIGCIAVGAILILANLSDAPLWATAIVLILTVMALWVYFRTLRPITVPPKLRLTEQDIGQLKGETLEEIADAFPRAVAVLDRTSKVIHANAAAQTLISADMIGRPIETYLSTTSIRPHLERAFEGETPPSLSVHIMQPTERNLDVDFSSAISLQPNDTQNAVVFAVLADRTLAAKEREQRADFLANASHELKTPIASLKGYIETLRGHAKEDPIAREKFLGIMAEQAERMERLVTDLLSLRRIESIEHIAPSETADLRKAIEAARNALDLLAETRGVKLIVELPNTEAATTYGKTDECVQLFLNLMENAIKLSPKGSTVRTRLEHLPNWSGETPSETLVEGAKFRSIVNRIPSDEPVWRATISDEGPGFSPTHLPRIGERFYRVAGDLPAQEKGTGLGLAIVKHIVMRHRAGLFLQSVHAGAIKDIPSGTSFSVVFTATDPAN